MRVALLSREYPPEVYGGAGVHVEYLARELAHLTTIEVHCFGAERQAPGAAPAVYAYHPWERLSGAPPYLGALRTISVNLAMTAGVCDADLVHSHTWYAQFGGHLAKLIYEIPHVATVHSLEPLRPWKAEQLGGGYELSKFCERTALEGADTVIAVSHAVRDDVLRVYPDIAPEKVEVVHNGIDPWEWHPDRGVTALQRHGIDPDAPLVMFMGRVTRQKGIGHLLDAAAHLDPKVQILLRAGAPDTPEMAQELAHQVTRVRKERGNVFWIEEMLDRWEVIQLLTHADVFCCPSIYEPLGLVNLEAMACETPVVATDVGGIPEVVVDDVTGVLVPLDTAEDGIGGPRDPKAFSLQLADAISELLEDRERAERLGKAGRQRVVDEFSWSSIAERILALYQRLVEGSHA